MNRHVLVLAKVAIVVISAILLAGAGCRKKPPDNAQKLAALEEGYRSGVFTKEEYESKKAALTGTVPRTAPPVPAAPAAPVADAEPAPPPQAPSPAPPSEPPAAPAGNASAAGCSDDEMRANKGKRLQERFFAAPPATVYKAAEAALANLDFTIHKQTATELEAARGKRVGAIIGAGGERVSLRLEAHREGGRSGTLVTGLTNQGLAGKITQRSWTSAVLAEIACQLGAR